MTVGELAIRVQSQFVSTLVYVYKENKNISMPPEGTGERISVSTSFASRGIENEEVENWGRGVA